MKVNCAHAELVATKGLKPHPKNPNRHPAEQIERLAKIIEFQGWRHPIIVSKRSGFIVAGHARWESAKKLKLKQVPVDFQDFADDAAEYAFLVSDNAIAEFWSETDLASVNLEIGDLGPDFDIDLLGIKDFTLDVAEKLEPGCEPDEAPALPKEAKSKLGDLWVLGRHRLLCGDATDIAAVDRLFGDAKIELCFTSPPYADQREYNGGKELSTEHLASFIRCAVHAVKLFAVNLGYARKSGAVFRYWDDYINEAEVNGLQILSWNVWDRGGAGTIGQQTAMFPVDHEWVFVFGKESKKLNCTVPNKWAGTKVHGTNRESDGRLTKVETKSAVRDRRPLGTVYRGDVHRFVGDENQHPAMFPVEFPEAYILACTDESESVYEPFGGSGTTLIACEKTDRTCYMAELDPRYVDVILSRFAKYSGTDPVRDDGVTWSSLNG